MTGWSVDGLRAQLDGFTLGPVAFTLDPGRTVAVLGRSGAGKTTLLRTLAGFLPVSGGRLRRDGVDLTDAPPERRGLGYVPQGLGLIPHRTVERNVSYPLEVRGRVDAVEATRPLLERFGLLPLRHRRPARLSGGELQRVALARALAADPELILWDEPWQALDVEARAELAHVLEELRSTERVPVVVVTHDPALAFSSADAFLVLDAGRCAFEGRPQELLDRPIDAFTARFVGYENLYGRAELDRQAAAHAGGLGAWLRGRAGPGGVAFARPTVAPGTGGGAWEGVVRSARPSPEGVGLTATVDGLSVTLRGAGAHGRSVPAIGERVRFDVEEDGIRPLPNPEDGGSGGPA